MVGAMSVRTGGTLSHPCTWLEEGSVGEIEREIWAANVAAPAKQNGTLRQLLVEHNRERVLVMRTALLLGAVDFENHLVVAAEVFWSDFRLGLESLVEVPVGACIVFMLE